MDPNTGTYIEMYEGPILVIPSDGPSYEDNDNTYYRDSIGYRIHRSNKNALDRPTVTIQIPFDLLGIENQTNATADYCLRAFRSYVDELNANLCNRSRPDKENGKYYLYHPGPEILLRNTAYFGMIGQKDYENGVGNSVYLMNENISYPPKMCLCIRIQMQLPYKKMRKTIQMLCRDLPEAVDKFVAQLDHKKLYDVLSLASKQDAIRAWLKQSEYCVFIANGSILPRSKGTDLPLNHAIPFKSTANDEIEVCGVRGIAIKRGVTVITGGGYSGKSTLLDAISAGIYDHIEGDGRELCITDASAVTICAEDGRSVKNVNISPFIQWIPGGNTSDFSTEHASGSTSQAANMMEAVNLGAKLLLIDEDKSATNFMIRDKMMRELIEKEPVIPFTDRVNELYHQQGVSTILIIGGSGEYISVADKIYRMDDFSIHDVTKQSKQICKKYSITTDFLKPIRWTYHRTLLSNGFTPYPEGSGAERLEISNMGFVLIGDELIDIRSLRNIVSPAQLTALGFMLRQLEIKNNELKIDIDKCIDELYEQIEQEGLDSVFSGFFTTCERFMDLPRKFELLAVINRMRNVNFISEDSDVQ
jgi:predicted ABC-class ATPase